jgi:hypothetical protein
MFRTYSLVLKTNAGGNLEWFGGNGGKVFKLTLTTK